MQFSEYKNRLVQLLLWLLPTGLECALYFFIGIGTLFLSNLAVVRSVLYARDNYNPIRSGIDSINQLLEGVVGERVAGSLSLAIFWGLVGLLVNAIWWLGSNFSTELNNDLVFSNYIHPKNYDPKSPLREFISRSIFRAGVAMLFIFYLNYVIREFLPHLSTRFSTIISNWSTHPDPKGLLVGLLGEALVLHGFVVLMRLLFLRKQVFGR